MIKQYELRHNKSSRQSHNILTPSIPPLPNNTENYHVCLYKLLIDNVKAVIQYDPEIEMFRGEFTGLNGGGDFYAENVKSLEEEGRQTLKVFFEMCKDKGIEPYKSYSGKFNTRVSPERHRDAALAAQAENLSMNALIDKALEQYLSQ